MISIITKCQTLQNKVFGCFKYLDGLPPLLFRLILAPVLMSAGWHKFANFDDMVSWFGNSDWGLGLPAPAIMVFLAAAAELFGGFALLIGLAVRLACIPLLVTMLVAVFSVHWEHGWFAIAPGDPETSAAKVVSVAGFPAAKASLENSAEVGKRLNAAKSLLREHGNYNWLTEKGSFVVLNNGIEFAATYFVILLSLFFSGGGRFFSVDYWLARMFNQDSG